MTHIIITNWPGLFNIIITYYFVFTQQSEVKINNIITIGEGYRTEAFSQTIYFSFFFSNCQFCLSLPFSDFEATINFIAIPLIPLMVSDV